MRKYSEEMDKMQQEAVRRMQEMQSRGKPRPPNEQQIQHNHSQKQTTVALHNTTDSCNSSTSNNITDGNSYNENSNHRNSCSSVGNSSNSSGGLQSGFFESIFQDKERSLILMLLILLSTEKTDAGLMLALVYLLI